MSEKNGTLSVKPNKHRAGQAVFASSVTANASKGASLLLQKIPQLGAGGANFLANALPLSILSSLLACTLDKSFQQVLQQFFSDFIPKGLYGGVLRAKRKEGAALGAPNPVSQIQDIFSGKANFNWNVLKDEANNEIPEWITVYLLGTLSAAFVFSRMCASLAFGKQGGGAKMFELLSHSTYELEKNLGKNFTFGKLNPQTVKITENLLHKAALAKFSLFGACVALVAGLEYCVPSLKVWLSKILLKTDNYYELVGLQEKGDKKAVANEFDPLKKASENIRAGLSSLFVSLPVVFGLTALGSKFLAGSKTLQSFLVNASRYFSLGPNFGLSKIFVATILGFAIPGYVNAARNESERKEVLPRVVMNASMAVAANQIIGILLGSIVGRWHGLGKIMPNFAELMQQFKTGERGLLDFGLIDLQKGKEGFTGALTKNAKLLAMSAAERGRILQTMHVSTSVLPYIGNLILGMTLGWITAGWTYAAQKDKALKKQ